MNLMKLNVYILPEAGHLKSLKTGSWKRNVDPSRAPIATNSESMSFTALPSKHRNTDGSHEVTRTDSNVSLDYPLVN